MTPGVPDPKGMMRSNRLAHSRQAGDLIGTEVIQISSERKITNGALEDHVVSKEHLAEEKCQMRAKRTVIMS